MWYTIYLNFHFFIGLEPIYTGSFLGLVTSFRITRAGVVLADYPAMSFFLCMLTNKDPNANKLGDQLVLCLGWRKVKTLKFNDLYVFVTKSLEKNIKIPLLIWSHLTFHRECLGLYWHWINTWSRAGKRTTSSHCYKGTHWEIHFPRSLGNLLVLVFPQIASRCIADDIVFWMNCVKHW